MFVHQRDLEEVAGERGSKLDVETALNTSEKRPLTRSQEDEEPNKAKSKKQSAVVRELTSGVSGGPPEVEVGDSISISRTVCLSRDYFLEKYEYIWIAHKSPKYLLCIE